MRVLVHIHIQTEWLRNRALLYLGVSVGDKNAITVERQVNINESDIVPRRGRAANNPRN
jgi:hypothetical protein